MLQDAINGVNSMQLFRELQNRFEMGDKSLSLADVMVAKEKSGMPLRPPCRCATSNGSL